VSTYITKDASLFLLFKKGVSACHCQCVVKFPPAPVPQHSFTKLFLLLLLLLPLLLLFNRGAGVQLGSRTQLRRALTLCSLARWSKPLALNECMRRRQEVRGRKTGNSTERPGILLGGVCAFFRGGGERKRATYQR
jgi:hypothetical protein